MLSFHRDRLAPPELCHLLVQIVPADVHMPVVFYNRLHPSGPYALGHCFSDHIDICLNAIYNAVVDKPSACLAAGLWLETLSTCLHEFGHMATTDQQASLP